MGLRDITKRTRAYEMKLGGFIAKSKERLSCKSWGHHVASFADWAFHQWYSVSGERGDTAADLMVVLCFCKYYEMRGPIRNIAS